MTGAEWRLQPPTRYTAKNQLYFSTIPTSSITSWYVDWNWYDAAGLRLVAQVSSTARSIYLSSVNPDQVGGWRTYYSYDGPQVALSVVGKKGGPWFVRQRFLSAGVDRPLAGWFSAGTTSTVRRLALVGDRQGTTMTTMTRTGGYETSLNYFGSDPFGRPENSTVTQESLHPETGFTGATAPSQGGGFVYLRNRWYDPQTGRFLTQDPIGLAGGVNLYSYAGNNPVSYKDPYGLCVPINVCLAVAGGAVFRGVRIASNLIDHKPWYQGVGTDVAKGAILGLTFGAAAPALATASVATTTEAGAAGEVSAAMGNKLNHIFGNPEHLLDGLQKELGGAAKAFTAIQQAINARVAEAGITGKFEEVVKVGSEMVTLRGKVVDGAVKLGTAFVDNGQ